MSTKRILFTCFLGVALSVALSVASFKPLLAVAQVTGSLDPAMAGPAPKFKKVMIVVLENTNFKKALAQPFMQSLARSGALLQDYYASIHPSQGNYISMVAGDTYGIAHDRNVTLDVAHIGDLLEAKQLSWKVYAEGYPGNCFLGAKSKKYVRKHVPFLSFKNVQGDPARCARIVEAAQLDSDLKGGAVPEYSMYIPDLNNDGHDTGVAFADKWLKKRFAPLLVNALWPSDMLLVVTFDESSVLGFNHIYTALYGAGVKAGTVSNSTYDHYSLLRTIEWALGIGSLGLNDAGARVIDDVWE